MEPPTFLADERNASHTSHAPHTAAPQALNAPGNTALPILAVGYQPISVEKRACASCHTAKRACVPSDAALASQRSYPCVRCVRQGAQATCEASAYGFTGATSPLPLSSSRTADDTSATHGLLEERPERECVTARTRPRGASFSAVLARFSGPGAHAEPLVSYSIPGKHARIDDHDLFANVEPRLPSHTDVCASHVALAPGGPRLQPVDILPLATPSATTAEIKSGMMWSACMRGDHIAYSMPTLPARVCVHTLRDRADGDGRVSTSALLPPGMRWLSLDEQLTAMRRTEGVLCRMLAATPLPLMRVVFAVPQVINIRGSECLLPILEYGNRVWMHMWVLPKFIPDAFRPAPGQPLNLLVAATALRIVVGMQIGAPLSTMFGKPAPTPQDAVSWSDDAIVSAFDDGIIIYPPHSRGRPQSHLWPTYSSEYFRQAASLIRACATDFRAHVRVSIARPSLKVEQTQPSPAALFDPHAPSNVMPGRDLHLAFPSLLPIIQRHPLVGVMLKMSTSSSCWLMDCEECVTVTYSPIGTNGSDVIAYSSLVEVDDPGQPLSPLGAPAEAWPVWVMQKPSLSAVMKGGSVADVLHAVAGSLPPAHADALSRYSQQLSEAIPRPVAAAAVFLHTSVLSAPVVAVTSVSTGAASPADRASSASMLSGRTSAAGGSCAAASQPCGDVTESEHAYRSSSPFSMASLCEDKHTLAHTHTSTEPDCGVSPHTADTPDALLTEGAPLCPVTLIPSRELNFTALRAAVSAAAPATHTRTHTYTQARTHTSQPAGATQHTLQPPFARDTDLTDFPAPADRQRRVLFSFV